MLNHPVPEEKARATLKELALLDAWEKHPMTPSGGQMQRLAIAVSLLSDREIVVFDEPTSGLDYGNMLRVGRIIRQLFENKWFLLLPMTRNWCKKCVPGSFGSRTVALKRVKPQVISTRGPHHEQPLGIPPATDDIFFGTQ